MTLKKKYDHKKQLRMHEPKHSSESHAVLISALWFYYMYTAFVFIFFKLYFGELFEIRNAQWSKNPMLVGFLGQW